MRILVCGSRGFRDSNKLVDILDSITMRYSSRDIVFITGDANGADRYAQEYAFDHDIENTIFKADWEKNGKSAGFIRNKEMLEKGKPDFVVAFWNGESKGTKHMIDIAFKAKISVIVHMFKEGEEEK